MQYYPIGNILHIETTYSTIITWILAVIPVETKQVDLCIYHLKEIYRGYSI